MERKYKRTDANQNEIVEGLRKVGCTVAVTSAAGDGFPDIVVGRTDISGERKNWLIETLEKAVEAGVIKIGA